MPAKNRIMDFLFYIIMGTLYAYGLARAVLEATVLDIRQGQLLVCCIVSLLALYLILFNKYTGLFTLGILVVSGLGTFLYLWYHSFEVEWFGEKAGFLLEVLGFVTETVPYREAFVFPIVAGVAALLALVTAINLRCFFSFYTLAIIGLATLTVPVILDYGRSPISVPIFLFCLVVFLAKKMNLYTLPRLKRGIRRSEPMIALGMIPLGLVIVGIAWLLPRPDMATVREGRSSVSESADELLYELNAGQEYFFSDTSEQLGGPVNLSQQIIMEVEAQEPLYLAGSFRDRYTGYSWTSSLDDDRTALEPEGAWYSVEQYSDELVANQKYYMRYYGWEQKRATITMGAIRVWSVHSPPHRMLLWLSEDDIAVSSNTRDELFTSRSLVRPMRYAQEYLSWNYESEYFSGVLRQLPQVTDVPGELEPYLQLPEDLPGRVGELARLLTAEESNNYDRAKALEAYLKQFPYTLNPDPAPSGADFVDHFLFEGQEGYCVYYATAMAVMGRTIGIPTRYVEGYVPPQLRNEQGNYTVTGAQAHAWTEVWFEGFGWVRFEPTAADFQDHADLIDEASSEPEEESSEPEEESSEPEGEEEESEESSREESLPGMDEEEQEGGGAASFWKALLTVLLLLLLAGGGGYGLVVLYRRRLERWNALPNREAVQIRFAQVLEYCGALGYGIRQGETAHTFAQRVGGEPVFGELGIPLEELAEIGSRAAFSENLITDRERARLEEACRLLEEHQLGSGKGRLRLLVDRYLRMRV